MASAGDRNAETRHDLHDLRVSDDLPLDPRRGKQEIDDHAPLALPRWNQTDRRQPACRLLLHEGADAIPGALQLAYERLGVKVIRNAHGQVGVTREPWLGPDGDRQAAHERVGVSETLQVGADAAEG